LNFVGIDPVRALFLSAVIMLRYLRVVGWIASGVMLVASLGFLISALHQPLAR
jgi:hypothetical protein